MRVIGVILCLCLSFWATDGLKILCLWPAVSYSHYTLGFTLAQDLAKRGHEVTLLAPHPEKEPIENLRTLPLTGFLEEWNEIKKTMNMFDRGNMPTILSLIQIGSLGTILVNKTLGHEVVQNLLHSNETFDAVILEHFISDGLRAIAYHFGAVPISLSPMPAGTWTNHLVGNIDLPSYITQGLLGPPIHTHFCNRVHNMLLHIAQKLFDHLFFYPKQNQIIHKYFPNFPHIYDLMYNTSLILLSSHPSFSESVPKLPNMIEIGGFHVLPPKKLPEDIQKILDNAKNGVVYFSMGSVLNSKDMPSEKRDAILNSLSKLKETVLWKYEEELPEAPSNVITRKWFPQSDLLVHPNIKLFITHGGMLSTVEALHRGVPIIGIPIYGDQKRNMANAVHRGQGIVVDFATISEEILTNALNEVLNNPKYTQNAKRSSEILRDQETTPLDRAAFWIDYVVRHKGARHLRAASLELTWYQHISLDVILFLVAITAAFFGIFYKMIKWWIRRRNPPKKQKIN